VAGNRKRAAKSFTENGGRFRLLDEVAGRAIGRARPDFDKGAAIYYARFFFFFDFSKPVTEFNDLYIATTCIIITPSLTLT